MAKLKELFLDIETSPCIGFFWRPGYGINVPADNIIKEGGIISAAWKWRDKKTIYSADWGQKQDESQVLEEILPYIEEADHLIYQNGDRFDLKWLRTRSLIHGLPMRPKYKTIDTLKMAKRLFNFNSNKLEYMSTLLTGEGKLETKFDLWRRIVLNKDQAALAYMVKYNRKDVTKLQEVYEKLAPYDYATSHQGVANGDPAWSCPHCGSYKVRTNKRKVTKSGTISHEMQCNDCSRYYTISDRVHLTYQRFRHGR